jgi:hypothetical protein
MGIHSSFSDSTCSGSAEGLVAYSTKACLSASNSPYKSLERSCDGGVNSYIFYENADCTSAIGVQYQPSTTCSSNTTYSCLASSSPYIFNYTSFVNTGVYYQYPVNTDKIAHASRLSYSSSSCGSVSAAEEKMMFNLNTCSSSGDGTYYYISYDVSQGESVAICE